MIGSIVVRTRAIVIALLRPNIVLFSFPFLEIIYLFNMDDICPTAPLYFALTKYVFYISSQGKPLEGITVLQELKAFFESLWPEPLARVAVLGLFPATGPKPARKTGDCPFLLPDLSLRFV